VKIENVVQSGKWQNNSGNFYSVADNIGDYTKAGIINTVIY
jgi:hypothetical protein